MLFAIPIFALLTSLSPISAQSPISSSQIVTVRPTERPLLPTGISEGSTETETTLPLACYQGCFPVTSAYFSCFINNTLSTGGLSAQLQETCDNFVCSQGNYTQLLDCANCIIANGNERPTGYHTNTALTATSTPIDGTTIIGAPVNPFGLIDEEQLNRWLANVTERCSSIDRAVTGPSTATASPTTTGPYYTSFGDGETISLPTWTGQTQYPPVVFTFSVLAGGNADGGSSASSGSSVGGNGTPTSSASSSESSPANHAISGKEGSAGLTALGMIVGLVVVGLQ